MIVLEWILWCSLGALLYAYAGYPLVIWICSRHLWDAADRADNSQSTTVRQWPFISLVLAAYKEERFIRERLENALGQDYPADRFEILVGCDGNEDRTGEIAREFTDPRVRLMPFPQRRGKASVLNDCVPAAQGEIVVFSDANTMMDREALRRLVRHFDDPKVGGVCGKLVLVDPATGKNVDGLYWRYENFLKRCEGRLGSLLGANGGIYAIRKGLYSPIPANTIIDDFVIGMRIHLQRRKLLYDASALAYEETPETISAEFHRRARIGAGGFQSLMWLSPLLNPLRGWLAFAFFSHKILRWMGPLFLLLAMLANAALVSQPFFARIALAQMAFYALAVCGSHLSQGGGLRRLLRLPEMFVSVNLALAVGFYRWMTGQQGGTWKRTERAVQVSSSSAP